MLTHGLVDLTQPFQVIRQAHRVHRHADDQAGQVAQASCFQMLEAEQVIGLQVVELAKDFYFTDLDISGLRIALQQVEGVDGLRHGLKIAGLVTQVFEAAVGAVVGM